MAERKQQSGYAYLDQLSTERLRELLRADLASDGQTDDQEVILHILEVIEARERDNPTGRLADVDQAWAEFQSCYHTPEGEGLSLYPAEPEEKRTERPRARPTGRRLFRSCVTVAATVGILFTLMVSAQAAGLDVFGFMARWSDETFHFVQSSPSDQTWGDDPETQEFFDEHHIPDDLLPTWVPEGFQTGEPTLYSDSRGVEVIFQFVNAEGEAIGVSLERVNHLEDITATIYQKDDTPVEVYTSNSRTFYIMSNLGYVTAAWADGDLCITIWGKLTYNEAKQMIDSIGGAE